MSDLIRAIETQSPILMDGALGTELERRGVPIERNAWSAIAVRDYGEQVTATHLDYLDAGARLHIVNSFALARHVLQPVGLGDDMEILNQSAVRLFEEAVQRSDIRREDVWAAGSLSTFAAGSDRSRLPTGNELLDNFRDQAGALFDAGIDLFALEMLFDVTVSLAMIESVREFGLPVIIGFTCDWQGEPGSMVMVGKGTGMPTMPLGHALAAIMDTVLPDNPILAIMHSEADVTDAALSVLREVWQGDVAIYPNSGEIIDTHLQFDTVCSDQWFSDQAMRWVDLGVQIIGGCCGIGPSHIAALKTRLNSR